MAGAGSASANLEVEITPLLVAPDIDGAAEASEAGFGSVDSAVTFETLSITVVKARGFRCTSGGWGWGGLLLLIDC